MAKGKHLKATDLARAIWRLAGRCENPDCLSKTPNPQLQGAHIFGVGAFPRLRADLRNGFCLCSVCHRYFTDAPRKFSEFIKTSWAEAYYNTLLINGRPGGPKIDWDLQIDFLKEVKRAIEANELTIEAARELQP